MPESYYYYKIFKPFGMLSQFTDKDGRRTLKELFDFPADVYPVGRLDMDSEGLLLLTNDKKLTDYLLNPKYQHKREYYVLVEGIPDNNDLVKLHEGIIIKDNKLLPATAKFIKAPKLPEREPPVRIRKTLTYTWLSITIKEGKNRQVRRMTAAIGFPTLRLIRIRIKNILLDNLYPGEIKALTSEEIKGLYK